MVGIDISDRSVKIAEVDHGGDTPHLRTVCWAPLQATAIRRGFIQDVSTVATQVQEAFSRCSPVPIEDNVVVASIPETKTFVRVIEVPDMKAHEMDEAVQWAVRQHIPFDLDRVYLDWQPLFSRAGDQKRKQVLVGAAQRDVVDPLLQVLDSLQLNVVALELEAQSIVRSLLPLQADDVHGVLIVDLGAAATNVIFFDEGSMRFTTSVPMGGDDLTNQLAHTLHIEPSVAAEKKAQVGVSSAASDQETAAALRQATTELVQKVARVADEMTAQSQLDHSIRAILLTGGAANLPGIAEVFGAVFPQVPVQMGNPWTNLLGEDEQKRAPLSTADAAHFSTALGLALRGPGYRFPSN